MKCRCEVSFTACTECNDKTPCCACYRPSRNSKTGKRTSYCYGCKPQYILKHTQKYNNTYYKNVRSKKAQETIEQDLQEAIQKAWYKYINKSAHYRIPRTHIKEYKDNLISRYGYKRCRQCNNSMDSLDKYCTDCVRLRFERRKVLNRKAKVRRRHRELITLHNKANPCQDGRYLYIITDGTYYKVGISKNPHQRIRGLKKKQGASNLSVLGIYKVLTTRAIDTERVIHKQLSPFNISYQYPSGVTSLEWFEAPLSLIKSCVQFHSIEIDCIS